MIHARRIPWLLVAAVALAAVTCSPARTVVTYRLEWVADGAERSDDELAFRNDLGHQIVLESALLTSWTVQMVECESEAGTPRVVPEAEAGHGDIHGSAAPDGPIIEDLMAATPIEVSVADVPKRRFCRVHYLAARASKGFERYPQMERKTLRFAGSVVTADGASRFALASTLANGRLIELDPPVATDGGSVTVIARRDLLRLFDGVDLTGPARDAERTILRNLVSSLSIEVRHGDST